MLSRFPDLVQLFDRLPKPQQNVGLGRFCVQPAPGFPACSVGKDCSGYPALLIETDNAVPGSLTPLVLECLQVMHLANCRVQHRSGGAEERTVSVIRCTTNDRAMHEYFLRSVYSVLASLPRRPSREDVTRSVDRMIELFRQMALPPRQTISGLWGELFVIAHSSNPVMLLRAWHGIPGEKFDFSMGADCVDVKAASGSRIHHFSLEQLRPASPARVIVVSLILERSQGGLSIFDLLNMIRNRVFDIELLLRLDQMVAETIGRDWRAIHETRFSEDVAKNSLRIIDAVEIPAVADPVPPEVDAVHFRVNLNGLPLSHPKALIESSDLFQSLAADSDLGSASMLN